MRVDSSTISLSAASSQTAAMETTDTILAQTDDEGGQQGIIITTTRGIRMQEVSAFEISDEDSMEIQLLQKLIEALTGKKMRFYIPEKYLQTDSDGGGGFYQAPSGSTSVSQSLSRTVLYQHKESYTESAQMSFSAAGEIHTADGKAIDIALNLNLSRSFTSAISTTVAAQTAVDPLIVNFGGASAQLTSQKYSFDIDNNGSKENISFATNGSSFLVLDKNADGVINNGSEMFGPSTGSGFIELSAYDGDGNGWIDENDSIYNQLQIWTKDEAGNDKLFAIGQAGIGAIYLGSISSQYALKTAANEQQGAIRESSIFLRENGTAGTIQHVDLSI